jgi:hypothetical protein
MGYKSVIRSVNTAGKKASREVERQRKQRLREAERLMKKHAKLQVKQQKVLDSLKDLYAKDKINKKEYEELKEREADIEIDVYVFGGTPGVNLSKQYITGKITKEEFNDKLEAILPSNLFIEKNDIRKTLEETNAHYEEHVGKFSKQVEGKCVSCDVPKSLFKWLHNVDEYVLCGTCKKNYFQKRDYKGFRGQYFVVSEVNFSDPGQIAVNILEEHILKIR